jgi:aminoglycoside phosphotransferase (APT) family kinase protein
MADYAPLPTAGQLEGLSNQLGGRVTHDRRIVGGLGGTMDVLRREDGDLVVLKRFWLPENGEVSPAETEFRSLTLAKEHGVPAPQPFWIDRIGLFPEGAVVTSFVDGNALSKPSDHFAWAAQLAGALVRIHEIRLSSSDAALFPVLDVGAWPHEEEYPVADGQHPLAERLRTTRAEAMGSLRAQEPVYLHHDYWPGNTLWKDERLVAVVDWEGGVIGDPAIDVACCAFDISLLGREEAAAHFVEVYRDLSGRPLPNLPYWQLTAAGRPMPDISIWLPGWEAMGVNITAEEARARHSELIERALAVVPNFMQGVTYS